MNLISRPDSYIFKDASLDTNIDTTYVRHVFADIYPLCQMMYIGHTNIGV